MESQDLYDHGDDADERNDDEQDDAVPLPDMEKFARAVVDFGAHKADCDTVHTPSDLVAGITGKPCNCGFAEIQLEAMAVLYPGAENVSAG